MFSGLMLNTWVAATVVAMIAGVTGFFAVLRGSTFAAHAIPNGAFAGAAGASLLGLNPFAGLAVFSVAGALGIAGLSRRARSDVATALTFVMMLGIGALLMFSLMIGPAAAARSLTARPGLAMALSVAIALVTVWAGIAISYRSDWPLGFFVGVIGAGFFLLGRAYAAIASRKTPFSLASRSLRY